MYLVNEREREWKCVCVCMYVERREIDVGNANGEMCFAMQTKIVEHINSRHDQSNLHAAYKA